MGEIISYPQDAPTPLKKEGRIGLAVAADEKDIEEEEVYARKSDSISPFKKLNLGFAFFGLDVNGDRLD